MSRHNEASEEELSSALEEIDPYHPSASAFFTYVLDVLPTTEVSASIDKLSTFHSDVLHELQKALVSTYIFTTCT